MGLLYCDGFFSVGCGWLQLVAVDRLDKGSCSFLWLVAVDRLDKGGCGFYTGYENRNQPGCGRQIR